MATPSLPWYPRLKQIIATTEGVANLVLIGIVIATLLILWKGDAVKKALWAVYLVSP
jgi:hypothetical protein